MPIIGPYSISSSNKTGAYPAAVRVKRNGVILADVACPHGNPLRWIRTRPRDPARAELVAQLREMEVSEDDIKMLLAMPSSDGQP